MSKTTISIDKDTREELKVLGRKDEDYDTIIKKCIKIMKTGVPVSEEVRQRLRLLALYKDTSYQNVLEELTEKELCELKLDVVIKNNKINKKKKR